jgi:hypothetical protein
MDQIQIPEPIQHVLKELGINNPTLLGKGGEGFIFTYNENEKLVLHITH